MAAGVNFRFHADSHGRMVALGNDRRTAKRPLEYYDHCLVMADSAMEYNLLYEVRVDEVDSRHQDTVLGLVLQGPQFLDRRPWGMSDPFTLYITPATTWDFGFRDGVERGWLRNLTAGTYIGLLLDEERTLHLVLDRHSTAVIARSVPVPCFFLFDLFERCVQITAHPVRQVDPRHFTKLGARDRGNQRTRMHR